MTIKDLYKKYGSIRNFIDEVYIIPAISLGVNYSTLLELTPISYITIVKGMQMKIKRELKEKDELNYLLSAYILSGVGGKPIKEPILSSQDVGLGLSEEEKKKHEYEKNKAIFLRQVEQINKNFIGKEE